MKITALKTNKDLEELLNRMINRIAVLEEQVRILDAEIAGICDSMVTDVEFDS